MSRRSEPIPAPLADRNPDASRGLTDAFELGTPFDGPHGPADPPCFAGAGARLLVPAVFERLLRRHENSTGVRDRTSGRERIQLGIVGIDESEALAPAVRGADSTADVSECIITNETTAPAGAIPVAAGSPVSPRSKRRRRWKTRQKADEL